MTMTKTNQEGLHSMHEPTAAPSDLTYDRTTVWLHWITAFLVAFQWIGAQVIDLFPRGPLRVDARSVHILFGVALATVLVARVLWRATRGRRLPPADSGLMHLAVKGVHWALYALLGAIVIVGIGLVWVRGDSIFDLFSIPAYDPSAPKTLRENVGELHEILANTILVVAGLHAVAALLHRYYRRDGVLARMLNF